jgi:hypothetical protein
MEHEQGYYENSKKKLSLEQRWSAIQPTKVMLFWACVASAICTMLVGFMWGGWVLGSTAQSMAEKTAEEAVTKRLATFCVILFNQDPTKDQKLSELKTISYWDRTQYIEKQGWATMAGEEKPDRKVAGECANLLMQLSQTTLAPATEQTSLLK